MERGFSLLPEQASTTAERLDVFFLYITAVCGAMTLLIAAIIIYFCVKYRRRPGKPETRRSVGSLRLELFWTISPLFVFLTFFAWGLDIYLYITHPPSDAIDVYVVGKQWMWKIQHSDGQREINQLHIPVDQPVRLTLISEDVIHSFFIPAFRTKVDVLPNRYSQIWFQATKPGRYHLFCAEYCGTDHSGMIGEVVVMRPEEYQAWLTEHAEGSLVLEGRKLFLKHQCATCHSADALARCPVLEGLYGQQVPLNNGSTVLVDDAYLRESIVEPDAKIVAGYEPIMPSFKGQITEEEMIPLIAFLKALGPGGTPPRVERSPPPAVKPQSPEKKSEKPESPPPKQKP